MEKIEGKQREKAKQKQKEAAVEQAIAEAAASVEQAIADEEAAAAEQAIADKAAASSSNIVRHGHYSKPVQTIMAGTDAVPDLYKYISDKNINANMLKLQLIYHNITFDKNASRQDIVSIINNNHDAFKSPVNPELLNFRIKQYMEDNDGKLPMKIGGERRPYIRSLPPPNIRSSQASQASQASKALAKPTRGRSRENKASSSKK